MTGHPRLHLLASGEGARADPFDGERRYRVRESGRVFEIVAVGECEGEAGAERIAGAGLIYHFRRKSPDQDLPPAA
ncbi:MAG TPA: hypothetical protein VIA63_03735, partial [Candidatus Limnocylindria bacterium]